MPDLTFIPVFTDAGRAKVAEAYGLGTSAKIKEIAIGTGSWAARETVDPYAPTEAALEATALVAERVRQPVFLGGNVAPNQVVMSVVIPGDVDPAGQFFFGEVGIFLDDGTLLAVAAVDAASGFGWRGAASHVLRFVLSWSQLPNNSITVEFSGDAGLNATFLAQQQLLDQIRQAVIEAGLTWNPNDPLQLSSAIAVLGRAYDEIRKPSITSPANGAVDVGETPTIAGTPYYSLYSVAHVSTTIEIATDADFDTVVSTQNAFGSTSVVVAGGTLTTDTTYFVRLRYADALGQLSAWSDTISFSTGATFVAVAQPNNIGPANGVTGASVTPTLTASGFMVTGGGIDTHIATRWRVYRIIDPSTVELAWDSGEVSAATSVVTAPLSTLTDYEWEVAYRGDGFGWSPWSARTEFTTGQPAGSHVDSTPGSRSFTVPAGVFSIRETVIGGGAGGGDGPLGRGTGGGGGGGARRTRAVTPGQVINYTVGEGGAVNTSGGTSSIDGQMSGTGGQRGLDNGPASGDGGIGVGGDLNGTGGKGGTPGFESGYDAADIGAGGGAMQDGGGGIGGAGIEGGGKGADAWGQAEVPGGGGRGRGNSPGNGSAGAHGQVKFEWGAGV